MGREVRRVSANWEHPKNEHGEYIPLLDGNYAKHAAVFLETANIEGLQAAIDTHGVVDKESYMPEWPTKERTHYQMYEDCTEGTPISPVMESPEKLARWLVDNNASSFGEMTANYDAWLRIARGGFAPSAVLTLDNRLVDGVTVFEKADD